MYDVYPTYKSINKICMRRQIYNKKKMQFEKSVPDEKKNFKMVIYQQLLKQSKTKLLQSLLKKKKRNK